MHVKQYKTADWYPAKVINFLQINYLSNSFYVFWENRGDFIAFLLSKEFNLCNCKTHTIPIQSKLELVRTLKLVKTILKNWKMLN